MTDKQMCDLTEASLECAARYLRLQIAAENLVRQLEHELAADDIPWWDDMLTLKALL